MDCRVIIGPKDKMILKITLKFDTYYITSPNFCVQLWLKIFPIIKQVSFEWASMSQHPPMHQLAIISMGWGSIFHLISINQLIFGFWQMSFFWGCFFWTLTSILPSSEVTLLTKPSYWPSYPTYQLPSDPLLFIYLQSFHWLNFYPLGKSLYLFLANFIFSDKTYILHG